MAEAFAFKIGKGRLEAISAGTRPSENLNHIVVQAMLELGIDISDQKPKMVTQEMVEKSDMLVSMGCPPDEGCNVLFTPDEDWNLDDPHEQPIDVVRNIRDKTLEKVQNLLNILNI